MDKGAIIYIRTSTEEQNPELQLKDCLDFCKLEDLKVVDIVSEQVSAYQLKNKRLKWEASVERAKKEKLNMVLWRYDRSFRKREEFYKFMKVMFEVYGVKIYSVKEPSIMTLWELMDKKDIADPIHAELIKGIMKVLWDFLIRQAGEEAEEESRRKSERVKLSIVKEEGKKTISYKGNKWGRKNLSQETKQAIVELYKQNKTYSQICSEVFYWDKSRNKKYVSRGVVHKIISQFKQANKSK